MAEIKVLEAFGEPIADGGQEAFVFGVLEKMDMEGLKVDCLTAYDCWSARYKSLVESLGGEVYALNLLFAPGKSRGNIRKPFREFLKSHHYDVIHIHSGSISVLSIMAEEAGKSGVKKVIVHSHASGENDNLRHKSLRLLASIPMAHHVDVYCACSKEAADWKFESRYAKKAYIIRNGIDTERFSYNPAKRDDMRKRLSFVDKYVIGHVGRFSKEKNHEFLIRVFERVAQSIPDARLLLVGAGDEIETVKSFVKEKHLEDNVIFTGSVTNVEDYLQAMDVFVLPSRFEGLGIVAIEAQCSGLPVIVSDRVPKTVSVTDKVSFLPLQGRTDRWVEEIVKYHGATREATGAQLDIIDIKHTARQVRKLYEK